MNNKNLKTIVFSLALATMALTANNMNAQNDGRRGLLGRGDSSESLELVGKPLFQINGERGGAINDGITGGITNGSFGEEVPLGGGIAILLVAGLGYVAIKKKEDEQ
jgi:hypothetical protein